MAKEQPDRKPLRQRVADRKRGIKETRPMSEKMKRVAKYLMLTFTVSQYLGLLMLLFSLGDVVNNNYRVENPTLIVVYCMMFLIGRFGIMIMKSAHMLK